MIMGNLEVIDTELNLHGWALVKNNEDIKLSVQLWIDDKFIVKTVADRYRADLMDELHTDGKHAFMIRLPYTLTSDSRIKVLVEHLGVQAEMNILASGFKENIEKKYNNLKKFILDSKLFDAEFYKQTYKDVQESELSEIEHFIRFGLMQDRKPNKKFDPVFYKKFYKDINTKTSFPFLHCIEYGKKEQRLQNKPEEKQNHNPTGSSYKYIKPKLTPKIEKNIKTFKKRPKFSIVIPVYNVEPKWLKKAIESIKNQWYENWEICIADDHSTNKKTINYLKSLDDKKIKLKFLEKNKNISVASNEALAMATGNYVCLMDHDDELTVDALYEVTKTINRYGSEFIYSDEDKIDMDGEFCEPHFKPDYAPDMFLSQNYISHLGVIKKELLEKVGGWEVGLEGSQDYDLYLKVLEQTKKIKHIPKVLYHWRKLPGSTASEFSEKSYANKTGKKALQNALQRRKVDAKVKNGKYPGTYKVEYKIEGNPLVSILIPFKDKTKLLKTCVESVLRKSTYENFEIIGISNNSTTKSIFKEMKRLEKLDQRVKFYEYHKPFNYSAINNYAVKHFTNGEQIVLMNNDIEILSKNWIQEMLMHSQRKDIGAVGAKLYYPNDTIQHAGVIIGIGGVAGHSHKYFKKNDAGYFSRLSLVQNFSAVTAALLMVKKSLYDEVNGLNEEDLKVAFNDVDFCLRVQELGYRNLFTPYCEAYHHESISRGHEDTPEKIKRFNKEVEYMQKMHSRILKDGDLYYNPNLTLDREDFSLKSLCQKGCSE